MPEVAEIKITSEELNQSLSGKYIISIDIREKAKHTNLDTIKNGTKFVKVYSKGKKIIFELEYQGKSLWILSSLLMEGHWGWNGNLPHIQFSIKYGRKISNRMYVKESIIYFDDTRYFGSNDVYHNIDNITSVLSNIGPDLLQETISVEKYIEVSRSKSVKNKQVCSFLLDQKYFSGIGNYMKSEILYRSKIRPDRTMSTLSDEELNTLLNKSIDVARESYKSGGLTIRSFRSPSGIEGKFECFVYCKKFDPYGNPVIRETFKDKRTTHWVSKIQM